LGARVQPRQEPHVDDLADADAAGREHRHQTDRPGHAGRAGDVQRADVGADAADGHLGEHGAHAGGDPPDRRDHAGPGDAAAADPGAPLQPAGADQGHDAEDDQGHEPGLADDHPQAADGQGQAQLDDVLGGHGGQLVPPPAADQGRACQGGPDAAGQVPGHLGPAPGADLVVVEALADQVGPAVGLGQPPDQGGHEAPGHRGPVDLLLQAAGGVDAHPGDQGDGGRVPDDAEHGHQPRDAAAQAVQPPVGAHGASVP